MTCHIQGVRMEFDVSLKERALETQMRLLIVLSLLALARQYPSTSWMIAWRGTTSLFHCLI